MSLFRKFFVLLGACFRDTSRKYEFSPIMASVIGAGTIAHALYARLTDKIESIHVIDKYQIYTPSGTQFVLHVKSIGDGSHHQMVIPYSVWYWQFDVPELWSSINIDTTYIIKSYGYRIPYLGTFRNIVEFYKEYPNTKN